MHLNPWARSGCTKNIILNDFLDTLALTRMIDQGLGIENIPSHLGFSHG